ncbi:MAG: type I methionyl aminopeptidase [Candidatus Aenigmarchaeota archaeon]|nr:type I methionyl aminopeptidase [Candidatus Aenigmarchaeota archaeon]
MITIKNKEEIAKMRQGGKILHHIVKQLETIVQAGMSTERVDQLAERLIRAKNTLPAFKGYKGFPSTICASINEEAVHGVPSSQIILRKGDLFSIDIGLIYQNLYLDTATTFSIGHKPDKLARRLMKVTRQALYKGIGQAKSGNKVSDIARAIQQETEKNGFSIIHCLTGHGVGYQLHESPTIPNFVAEDKHNWPDLDVVLKSGMTIAIEPIVSAGKNKVKTSKNGWTVMTTDDSLTAHFEHSLVITETGNQILT